MLYCLSGKKNTSSGAIQKSKLSIKEQHSKKYYGPIIKEYLEKKENGENEKWSMSTKWSETEVKNLEPQFNVLGRRMKSHLRSLEQW